MPKMTRNLIFSAVTILFLAACSAEGGKQGAENPSGTDTTTQDLVSEQMVETMVLGKQLISRSIEYTSTLTPFEENHLASAAPGRIEEIFVEIGDHVKKGEILVQMDRTQLHQAEIQLKNVETDYKRLDTLNKVGGISEQQYDQIKSQYDIASSNVKFLQENTVLRAPFSGVIFGKYYENGEFYSGAPNTQEGKAAVVSILQINPMKVMVDISEKYFPMIKTGMDATVGCDIYPGMSFPGKVERIHPTIDPGSRTFTIEVKINNDKELLRPGMFSRVSMELGKEMALVVPAVAVLKLQGSNERYMFLEENGTAKRITVQLGKRFDDKVEIITDQLKEGDHIIVKGQAKLIDGDKVRVAN